MKTKKVILWIENNCKDLFQENASGFLVFISFYLLLYLNHQELGNFGLDAIENWSISMLLKM